MKQKIQKKAAKLLPLLKEIRQHLHRNPELSFKEFKTAEFIAAELDKINVTYTKRIAGTGIVALIKGKSPDKKCIALRADMDALPIQEKNDIPYKSQNDGVMHACGHDVHSTCLLGAAHILESLKDNFEGTIKLIFQPGEEQSPGGANLMIREKVLENPNPDAIFALHVDPSLSVGKVGFKTKQYMASADEIHITIIGKGGHAALPHLTVDPISIAALIITALQQIVSRKNNPLMPTVLTFGKIEGGNATNIIPNQVILAGTLRTFNEEWRQEALILIRKITRNIAEAYGAEVKLDFPPGYPSLYNDESLTLHAIQDASTFLGPENVAQLTLRMTAEDFSFFAQKRKACFFRLGTNIEQNYFTDAVHTSTFNISEEALKIGTGMLTWLAIQELNRD